VLGGCDSGAFGPAFLYKGDRVGGCAVVGCGVVAAEVAAGMVEGVVEGSGDEVGEEFVDVGVFRIVAGR